MTASASFSDLPLWSPAGDDTSSKERSIEARFQRFHAQHPDVYHELVRLCYQAKDEGVEKVGIGMLWEVLRWNRTISGDPSPEEDYKLNNTFRSRYARLIMEREPDLRGIFETRELQSA